MEHRDSGHSETLDQYGARPLTQAQLTEKESSTVQYYQIPREVLGERWNMTEGAYAGHFTG